MTHAQIPVLHLIWLWLVLRLVVRPLSQSLVWDATCPDSCAPSHLALAGFEASSEAAQSLVWDATCPDTCAPSHLALAGVEADNVVEAEVKITRGQNIASWTLCTFYCLWPSRHNGSFWPCGCSHFFKLIWGKGS